MIDDSKPESGNNEAGNIKLPDSEFNETIKRLQLACDVGTDLELAQVLGIKRQSISAARKRGVIPSNWIIAVGEKFDVSLDWLMYGIEPKWRRNTKLHIQRLKKLCEVRTDEQFAELIGVRKADIDEVREKKTPIPLSWLLKISKITEYSFDWLSSGTGPKFRDEIEKKTHDKLLEEEKLVSTIDIIPIDEELITDIVVYLEKKLEDLHRILPPTWKAHVITTSYESIWHHDTEKRAFDPKVVDACLHLAIRHGDSKKAVDD